MAITDKTRKILWGGSGNRCAFCKARLVMDASDLDSESVVGDECHIISGSKDGPRHDAALDAVKIDLAENLILLCKTHHKLVDDQEATFSVDALKLLKKNHEKWVEERLSQTPNAEPIKLIRNKSQIPKHLIIAQSARELLDLMSRCHGRYDGYPKDLSESELDLIGSFLQELSDWGDVGLDSPSDWITAEKSLSRNLAELNRSGFEVYVGREKQELRGGNQPTASNWYMMHLQIARRDDPNSVDIPTDTSV